MFEHETKTAPAFKRGQFLVHAVLGIVQYARKVRNKPEQIVVKRTDNGEHVTVAVNQIAKSDVRKAGKMQGTRQVLIMCFDCSYRLRGSSFALNEIGIPNCPGCGKQMEIVE